MRRLAFRRRLPLIQLALFSLLYPAGRLQIAHLVHHHLYPEPWLLTICHALNAPAFLFAGLFNVLVFDFSRRIPFFYFWVVGLCVALQWYLVGSFIDRRLRPRAANVDHIPDSRRRFIAWAAFVTSTVIALLSSSLYMLSATNFRPRHFSMGLWLSLWFGVAAVLQWRAIARWRKPGVARAAASSAQPSFRVANECPKSLGFSP